MSRHRLIEDGRPRSWWWMDNQAVDDLWIAYVGVYAWAIYCVLVRHADDRGRAMPSREEISKITGISLSEVKRSLKVLLGSGLVKRARKGSPTSPTVYQVRALPESKNTAGPTARAVVAAPPQKAVKPNILTPTQAKEDGTRSFLSALDDMVEEEIEEQEEVVVEPEPEPETKPEPVGMMVTKTAAKSSRQKKLPKNWKPNDTHRRIATEEGVDLEREVTGFRDHAEATGRTMLDWDAAFRTWLRNARGFNKGHYGNGSKGARSAEQIARDEVGAFYEQEVVV